MYCLDPPLDENPEGSWFCPRCPQQVEPQSAAMEQEHQEPPIAPELQIDPALQMEAAETAIEIDPVLRGESVASTVLSEPQPAPPRRRGRGRPPKNRKNERVKDRKGKGRALILSDDDEEEEVEIEALVEEEQKDEDEQEHQEDEDEEEMYPAASTPKGRAPLNNRRKSSARIRRTTTESVPDDVERPSPPLRPPKRMKLTVHSPSPPPRQRQGPGRPKMVVKLRLPGKGKGREDEEEEEPRKGMFDDFLDERERDTSKTIILHSDKERFEKARSIAEVCFSSDPFIAILTVMLLVETPSSTD